MSKLFSATLMAFLLVAACFGQTTHIQRNISSSTLSGDLTSGASDLTNTVALSAPWVQRGDGIIVAVNSSWVPPETRKPNRPGPTLAQIKLAALHLQPKDLPPSHYVTLAKLLGVESAQEAQLVEAIHAADLPLYDFDKVDGYLYRQALQKGANYRWVWKPAREDDLKAVTGSASAWRTTEVGFVHPALYARKLPMQVLATMKALLDAEPSVVFLVSDYEVAKPDPFLAVTTVNLLQAGKLWIVVQWDEPGFGDSVVEPTSLTARR